MKKRAKKPEITFEQLLEERYGSEGSTERTAFEAKAELYKIGELLKDTRKETGMTQQELAYKIGTQKSYISRLENGKTDVQVSTLFRIFEEGLGKKVILYVE